MSRAARKPSPPPDTVDHIVIAKHGDSVTVRAPLRAGIVSDDRSEHEAYRMKFAPAAGFVELLTTCVTPEVATAITTTVWLRMRP